MLLDDYQGLVLSDLPSPVISVLACLLLPQVMEDSMAAATTLSTPKSDVDALIQQVAEEAGLDMVSALPGMESVGELSTVGEKTKAKEMDELDQRLASLRN